MSFDFQLNNINTNNNLPPLKLTATQIILNSPEIVFKTDSLNLGNYANKLASPLQLFGINNNAGHIPTKLAAAANTAYLKHKGKAGHCEATANDLHRILSGKKDLSVRYLPKANGLNEKGKPLSYLKTLIEQGQLKPGMVIFINTKPDMSLRSLSPSNRHWFTYMGKDPATNKPVFHDQFGTNRSLEKMLAFRIPKVADIDGLKERKIHTIFDPYADTREQLY